MRSDRHDGFALIELLVAMIILAFGLLGNFALLVAGLQSARNANQLAAAATLASDLGERIRANPAAGLAYSMDPLAEPPAASTDCSLAAPSTSPVRAACDIAEWQQDVASVLPGAEVQLTASSVADTAAVHYVISIRWVVGDGASGGRYALQLQV